MDIWGFPINGVPKLDSFCQGKSIYKWMIWRYPFFRKPAYYYYYPIVLFHHCHCSKHTIIMNVIHILVRMNKLSMTSKHPITRRMNFHSYKHIKSIIWLYELFSYDFQLLLSHDCHFPIIFLSKLENTKAMDTRWNMWLLSLF